ncbi:TadE/TadG family type IV pilus assembly protein [Streptomyces sp. BE133]|uniref:TadE/TadG family type IV pilus assembly protein n=1 Tax=Streptomyces sp. BE133 TaxID=3002523 RepID=UPI002E767E03|nr:TadE/TadG family type IV pilus assembly protein [Streptomyces sp. BE133]MEE1807105.1 TadE/TadG family type IV pilus assembly protein [Streptomyces sp. BE133]
MSKRTHTPGRMAATTTATPRRDRGQVAIEYLGFIPLLLLVGLLAIQAGLAAYAANQAGTGARAGARMASMSSGGCDEQAAKDAMSDWTADLADVYEPSSSFDEVTCTVSVDVPDILPGVNFWGTAERSSTMPRT